MVGRTPGVMTSARASPLSSSDRPMSATVSVAPYTRSWSTPDSQDRDGVHRRAGAAGEPERSDHDTGTPTGHAPRTRSGGLRTGGSRADTRPSRAPPTRASGTRSPRCCRARRRCWCPSRGRIRGARPGTASRSDAGPPSRLWCPTVAARQPDGMAGPHQQDVAGPTRTPRRRSACSSSAGRIWSPGSSQSTPRRSAMSSSTPRPTRPSRSSSIDPCPAPSAVIESSGNPP